MLRERERGLCSELLMTKRPMLMREGVGKLVREGVVGGGWGLLSLRLYTVLKCVYNKPLLKEGLGGEEKNYLNYLRER